MMTFSSLVTNVGNTGPIAAPGRPGKGPDGAGITKIDSFVLEPI